MTMRRVLAAFFALAVVVAAPAFAQEISGSGESIIVDTPPKETPLPDGYTFLELENRQILMAADASHPFHHVALTCTGTCRVNPEDGSAECAGGCTGRDPAGDVVTLSWDGKDGGSWTLLGGSGKWSMARGSGRWKNAGPMGAGFTRNTWTGSIRMR